MFIFLYCEFLLICVMSEAANCASILEQVFRKKHYRDQLLKYKELKLELLQ